MTTLFFRACSRCNGAVLFDSDEFGKPELRCVNCGQHWAPKPAPYAPERALHFASGSAYTSNHLRDRAYQRIARLKAKARMKTNVVT
jgi:hypothetical protein